MAHVFVIAGHGAGDPGACAHGYSEAERVRALAQRMKDIGGDNVTLGDFNRNYYADGGVSNLGIPKDWPVIELHQDSASASARGGHVIIKSGYSADAYDNALANFIGGFFPGRSQLIVGRSDLANPNRAAAAGYNYRLLECCFISNYDDITKFNNQIDDVARGILQAFGINAEKPKRDMSEAQLAAIPNQAYTGGEIKPSVSSGAGATFGVRYENNVNVGWGTVVCSGVGDWTGEARVSFKILPASLVGYSDIDPAGWYIEPVQKVVERKIMTGCTSSNFGPDDALTRAQAVAVIYKAAGMVDDGLPYSDVEQAPWYYEATKWATEQGVLKGDSGLMRPNDACSREEFVTMLNRWRGNVPTVEPKGYNDWNDVSEYARPAMAWAVESGVLKGSDGYLRPKDACSRAQAAAMVIRLLEG